MAHPLLSFAQRIEEKARSHRRTRDLERAISDPHIARDVGLPYNPRPNPRIDQW